MTSSATQRLELQLKERLAARSSRLGGKRGGGGAAGGASGGGDPSEVALSVSRLVTQQAMRGAGGGGGGAIQAADVAALAGVPDETTWDAIKAAFVAQSQHLEKATAGEEATAGEGGGATAPAVWSEEVGTASNPPAPPSENRVLKTQLERAQQPDPAEVYMGGRVIRSASTRHVFAPQHTAHSPSAHDVAGAGGGGDLPAGRDRRHSSRGSDSPLLASQGGRSFRTPSVSGAGGGGAAMAVGRSRRALSGAGGSAAAAAASSSPLAKGAAAGGTDGGVEMISNPLAR